MFRADDEEQDGDEVTNFFIFSAILFSGYLNGCSFSKARVVMLSFC
jgi:hypothetical protein